jgi:hypothetical protein
MRTQASVRADRFLLTAAVLLAMVVLLSRS